MTNINELKNDLNTNYKRAQEDDDQVALYLIDAALDLVHKLEARLDELTSWEKEVKLNPNIDKSWP